MTIHTINVSNVKEFWRLLNPTSRFIQRMSNPIFRGHSNSEWLLQPKIYRNAVREKYFSMKLEKQDPSREHHFIFWHEWFPIVEFIYFCDKQGLPIPNDTYEFRKLIDFNSFTEYISKRNEWPNECYTMLALGQHYGIPTRLLDWTHNVLAAIYFASSECLSKNSDEDEFMAIWIIEDYKKISNIKNLKYIEAPNSTNKNLSAQSGCFITHPYTMGLKEDSVNSMESQLQDIIFYSDLIAHKICIKTFTDNASRKTNAAEILKWCMKYYFTSAYSLFPGYNGAAASAMETSLIKKHLGLI